MPETSFEQTAVMNANKSTTITQYTTENLILREKLLLDKLRQQDQVIESLS